MGDAPKTVLHATAIAIDGFCALIFGSSGSGKSDLALRCLSLGSSSLVPSVPILVSDDQVIVERVDRQLIASPPPALAGKLEVRSVGIIDSDYVLKARIILAADLSSTMNIERYPDPWPQIEILNVKIPVLRLQAFEASAPLKLAAALTLFARHDGHGHTGSAI